MDEKDREKIKKVMRLITVCIACMLVMLIIMRLSFSRIIPEIIFNVDVVVTAIISGICAIKVFLILKEDMM